MVNREDFAESHLKVIFDAISNSPGPSYRFQIIVDILLSALEECHDRHCNIGGENVCKYDDGTR